MAERRPYPPDTRYSVTDDGRVFRDVRIGRAKPRELTQYDSKRGYLRVQFEGEFHSVHQMVAVTFIPNPEGKPEVAHRDGVKHHNAKTNLRWATRKENSDDMDVHGTRLRGDNHPSRILSEVEVLAIYKAVRNKRPRAHPYHREIADQFGVTRECVTRIANDQRWVHATSR
jgi:hypothetical protein